MDYNKEMQGKNLYQAVYQLNNDEFQREKEFALVKELYPPEAKKFQAKIEKLCDKYDYNGSFLYDEYPDKIMLRKLARDILAEIEEEPEETEDMVYSMDYRKDRDRRNRKNVLNLIEVLLYHELFRRRHGGMFGNVKRNSEV